MTLPRRHEQAKEIFFDAISLPEGERRAFVEKSCGDDRSLFDEVASLLEFQREEPPPRKDRERFSTGELFARRYRIVSLVGQGGMGEVYRAHDLLLDEPVAL